LVVRLAAGREGLDDDHAAAATRAALAAHGLTYEDKEGHRASGRKSRLSATAKSFLHECYANSG